MNSGGVETIQTKRCRNLPRFVLFGSAQECLLKQGFAVTIVGECRTEHRELTLHFVLKLQRRG